MIKCSYCSNPAVLSTVYRNSTEHWCDGCWETDGGWVCDKCGEFLPIWAYERLENELCDVCLESGRATDFEAFV